jgi:hypothetical protein
MTTTKTSQTTIQQKLYLNNMVGNKQAEDLLRLALAYGANLERLILVRNADGSVDILERKCR